jgi:uncharacterized protein (TIGR03067 family)
MNPHAGLVLLAGALLIGGGAQDAVKKELARLQGTWQTVSVEINGSPLEQEFKEDRLVIKGADFTLRAGKGSMKGTLRVDPGKTPPTIDTEVSDGANKGVKSVGIYELRGDTLKVCYAPAPNPRPTEFKTAPKSGTALVVYRRIKP